MTIKSLQSTSLTNNVFYRSMLAGNDAFFPEFESDEFLEEVVLTSSASSVTFTGLASYATAGYKHLQIRSVARTDRSNIVTDLAITLNGVTTSSYAWHALYASGSSVSSAAVSNSSNIRVGSIVGASATSGHYAPTVIDLLDFNSSTKNSTVRSLSGRTEGTQLWFGSGLFNSTSVVTSIGLQCESFNFVSGSRFSLYGSKG